MAQVHSLRHVVHDRILIMQHPPLASGATPSRANLPGWHDRVLVLAFVASLAAPHVAALCGWCRPFDPQAEKRPPVGFPQVAWTEAGWLRRPRSHDVVRFPAGLEGWLLDRTGFRQESVAAVGSARLAGWLPGETVAECMPARLRAKPARRFPVRGADGWCYFIGARQVEELQGRGAWPEARIAATWRRFEERRAWLAAHGIAYVVVAAPDKESIYPEHLPGWAAGPRGRTPLDQLAEYAGRAGGPQFVDLRPDLRAAKSSGRTYYAEDTHWNSFGSLVGCRAVLAACGRHCAGLVPPPLEDYVSRPDVHVGGDLARMLGTPRSAEVVDVFECRNAGTVSGGAGREPPRVFVLGDSFGRRMLTHMAGCCSVVGTGGCGEFPTEAILAARPAIVIHEFVERNLAGVGFANPQVVVAGAAATVAGVPDAASPAAR